MGRLFLRARARRAAVAAVGAVALNGVAVSAADSPSVLGTWRVEQVITECSYNGQACHGKTDVTRGTGTIREQVYRSRRRIVLRLPYEPGNPRRVKSIVLH